jgi:hypothetical protein
MRKGSSAVTVVFAGAGPASFTSAVGRRSSFAVEHVAESAFDVRQYTFIPWKTTEGLAKSLRQRIGALGLSLNDDTA